MESIDRILPPPPSHEQLTDALDAARTISAEADHARQMQREIAVALMQRSGLPIVAISEAIGRSRPTLYAWQEQLAAAPEQP